MFADRAAVLDAFEALARRAPVAGRAPLVVNVGDPGVAELVAARLADWPGPVVGVALVDAGAAAGQAASRRGIAERFATRPASPPALLGRIVEADAPTATTLEIARPRRARRSAHGPPADGRPPQRLERARRGRGGRARARARRRARSCAGLASFPGVGRRLERKGEAGGVVVYDDYGHHPTAIRATLAAVRQREPGRRVWAVYEPLTYHRTAAMLDDFADALAAADAVAIADIWAGRDPDTTIASAEGLAAAVRARAPGHPAAAPGLGRGRPRAGSPGEVRPGDVVLVMGGGRSYRIGELLLEQLEDA